MCTGLRLVDVVDHGGQGRGLPGAGRPGDEHQAAVLLGELAHHVGQAELVERRSAEAELPEHHADRAALAEHVHAEPADVRRPSRRSRPRPRSRTSPCGPPGSSPSAIACVSIGLSGSRSSRTGRAASAIIGGEPTFTCRSDPSPSTSSSSQELNSGTIGEYVHRSSAPSRLPVTRPRPHGDARLLRFPSAGWRWGLQSFPGEPPAEGNRTRPRKTRSAMATEAEVREALRRCWTPRSAGRSRTSACSRASRSRAATCGSTCCITIEGCPLKDRITQDVTAAVQPLDGRRDGRGAPHADVARSSAQALVGEAPRPGRAGAAAAAKISFSPSTSDHRRRLAARAASASPA